MPETWELASNNVFTENGETKSAGYFATLFENTSPTLSIINPEDAMGYISHQTVELNNKTQALLTITAVFMGKENIPIPSERIYAYNYDVIHGNYILSITFQEIGFDNQEGIEFHKKYWTVFSIIKTKCCGHSCHSILFIENLLNNRCIIDFTTVIPSIPFRISGGVS